MVNAVAKQRELEMTSTCGWSEEQVAQRVFEFKLSDICMAKSES